MLLTDELILRIIMKALTASLGLELIIDELLLSIVHLSLFDKLH